MNGITFTMLHSCTNPDCGAFEDKDHVPTLSMMSLSKIITTCVAELIELIETDEDSNPPINQIIVSNFNNNNQLPWVRTSEIIVSALMGEKETYRFKYAIYINRETGMTETDAF